MTLLAVVAYQRFSESHQSTSVPTRTEMKMRIALSLVACILHASSTRGDVIEVVAPAEGVESVTVLPNGTVIEAAYEAVDLKEAAAQALPDGELKSLLNWAIS